MPTASVRSQVDREFDGGVVTDLREWTDFAAFEGCDGDGEGGEE